jgi:polysaccharide deacetylase family protein (PEP-CTERM system associated)
VPLTDSPRRLCLTIDVEDWVQSTFDFDAPLTDRCRTNTLRMLDLIESLGWRATCFVQGYVARDYPQVVADIAARGHEVGCHSLSHRPLHVMDAVSLRRELAEARSRIEDAGGYKVVGFRAPDFSVGPPCDRLADTNRDVFRALAEQGYVYDSSVVPARMRRYGVRAAPPGPFRLQEGPLEIPLGSVRLHRRLPALGGGYLRIFPLGFHRLAMAQADEEGRVPVVYVHPYELAEGELAALARSRRIPLRLRLSQGLGRASMARKLIAVLRGRQPLLMRDLADELAEKALPAG